MKVETTTNASLQEPHQKQNLSFNVNKEYKTLS